jgi:hypothetical protein
MRALTQAFTTAAGAAVEVAFALQPRRELKRTASRSTSPLDAFMLRPTR